MPQEDPAQWSVRELRAFLAARGDATCAHATEKKELADRVRVLLRERAQRAPAPAAAPAPAPDVPQDVAARRQEGPQLADRPLRRVFLRHSDHRQSITRVGGVEAPIDDAFGQHSPLPIPLAL